MIRHLNISGEPCPADFSIFTLAQLARKYDTDITGLGELLAQQTSLEEQIRLVASIGEVALNNGAKREGIRKHYTEYDLYDALTADMSLSGEILSAFSETFKGSTVFPMPSKGTAKPKKPKGGA